MKRIFTISAVAFLLAGCSCCRDNRTDAEKFAEEQKAAGIRAVGQAEADAIAHTNTQVQTLTASISAVSGKVDTEKSNREAADTAINNKKVDKNF